MEIYHPIYNKIDKREANSSLKHMLIDSHTYGDNKC